MRQNKNLEHFQAKWTPVRVKKMRKNKNLERRSDLIRSENALEHNDKKGMLIFVKNRATTQRGERSYDSL
jgi:hypothetical protein